MSQQAGQASQPVSLTREGEHVLFPSLPYAMGPRIEAALEDEQLQMFLRRATVHKVTSREASLRETFGDGVERMRELAAAIKQHTLDHLDQYLEQFIDAAERAGATVHFAADAEQANAIITSIAREAGCGRCVKTKSMVTEEIGLLPALEEAGIETVETDLAEFILQLDGDAPSHIVTAMIHKDRKAVAEAFVRELGVEYTEQPEELTKIARDYLRAKFREADLGVIGGNFLVAETGSIVLCTNEGNGRMCTTLPRVVTAVVGIEKLVPGLTELAVMLKMLTRSSTGQAMTCYTTMLTGPGGVGDMDGPEQLHIVLLDNGRTKLLGAGESRELLRCVRCGACLNACPVYRRVGGHAYGGVYSGPIGALLTPLMRGLENYPDLPNASSLCGACYEVCPVKIDIPRQLIRLRKELVGKAAGKWHERWVYRLWALSYRWAWSYRLVQRMQRWLMRGAEGTKGSDPWRPAGWVDRLPGPLRGWTDERDMPAPAAKSFRAWWEAQR